MTMFNRDDSSERKLLRDARHSAFGLFGRACGMTIFGVLAILVGSSSGLVALLASAAVASLAVTALMLYQRAPALPQRGSGDRP